MHHACDDVLVAIGQENAFPWIERDIGVTFAESGLPIVDRGTMQSTHPGVFFGGDAAFGPKNIIWAVAHGHEAAISIDHLCRERMCGTVRLRGFTLSSERMGIHEWSYDNDIRVDRVTGFRTPERRPRSAIFAWKSSSGLTSSWPIRRPNAA